MRAYTHDLDVVAESGTWHEQEATRTLVIRQTSVASESATQTNLYGVSMRRRRILVRGASNRAGDIDGATGRGGSSKRMRVSTALKDVKS